MKRSDKERLVADLHEQFSSAKSAVLLDYKGLNVAEITDLRSRLRNVSVELRVVKNTLSKRAAQGTQLEKLETFFQGPTAAVIAKDDSLEGLKVIDKFIKDNPKLEYKVAVLDGTVVDKSDISKFADLPSKDVLRGMFLGTLQAPVTTFVRLMAGTLTGLVNVLNGIKESKSE